MQTLFGIKITDRVQVHRDEVRGRYYATFDGEDIGVNAHTGVVAVRRAVEFLQERAKQQALEAKLEEKAAEQSQFNADEEFLYQLSDRLGISKDDLDALLEIAKRRNADVP